MINYKQFNESRLLAKFFASGSMSIYIAIGIAFCLVYCDSTILSIALPTIQQTFNTTQENTLWVVNSYMLMRAILVFAAGRLGDIFTHTTMFLSGLGLLALSSLGCAIANHINMMIFCRGLQGVAATFIFISGMSLITIHSPPNKKASRLGLLLSVSLAGTAAGPVVGGFFIKYFTWQAIFYLNIFLCLVSVILSVPFLKNNGKKVSQRKTFDMQGFFLSLLFTTSFTLAFENSNTWGWLSHQFILMITLGISSLLLFIFTEFKKEHPLVDLRLFYLPNFMASCLVASFVQVGVLLIVFLGIFLQNALGYSPMTAGLLLLPMIATGVVFSNIGGHLGDKYGPKLPLLIGTGAICVGLSITLMLFNSINYYRLLPLLIFSGIGMFMISGPIRAAMISNTPPDRHGMVNSILTGMRSIISVIGFAITGAIIINVQYFQSKGQLVKIIPHLTEKQIQILMGLLAKTNESIAFLNHFDPDIQFQIKTIVLKSYINGFFWSLIFVGILSIISHFLTIYKIKNQ